MDEVPGVLAEDDAEEGKVTEVTAVLEETVEVVGVEVIAILEKLREFSSEWRSTKQASGTTHSVRLKRCVKFTKRRNKSYATNKD